VGMKKRLLYAIIVLLTVSSCGKELSTEFGSGNDGGVIGADCRISKIAYNDSASGVALGSISAIINGTDKATAITLFDSLSLSLIDQYNPQYFGDTIAIDPDQYFVIDNATKRIQLLHGLIDPGVPGSQKFEIDYTYDASGYLTGKLYSLVPLNLPFVQVNYAYTGGNLTSMLSEDLFSGDVITDATVTYYNNIAPKNYIYIFPDEDGYAPFNQFYNFGKRSTNAVKDLKVRYYNSGIVSDSSVSSFINYTMSRDNYVVSVNMVGDDQPSIPAMEGKLNFAYKCK
jgi:hypothetical protein